MGAYTWLNESEFKRYSSVSDKEVNEALQEVREVMPEWYIDERKHEIKRWFKKPITKTIYTVYQRTKEYDEGVRLQLSATSKETVLNLLYGLYMGYHSNKQLIN